MRSMKTADHPHNEDLEKRIKLLNKIAEINGRRVIEPLFEDGLFQTMEYWGAYPFTGTLDMAIEWEKGYANRIEWTKKKKKELQNVKS